ncbi:MAG: F0F1 ATP synthase subunit gamma [Prevotellaceae bacterium]|jgi:F-type H+-transporting ATPase subunit gamma|nr:F0F1 ATP synthase subunit gamma [Prevotellaceae bacterium]
MASHKEIKARIASVKTTRKITAAMKMVSAAKLNRAQKNIAGMLPYAKALHHILGSVLTGDNEFDMPLTAQRTPERVAIIAFSSDGSLAGAFNANIIKEMRKTLKAYDNLPPTHIYIYTIGKKAYEAATKSGYTVTRNFEGLAAKPDYDTMAAFASELITQFHTKAIDRVEVIYHHFKSAGAQTLTHENFLPLAFADTSPATGYNAIADYLFEPSASDVLAELLPKVLKLKLYTILLDSNASEHAARVVAMQIATDNADELTSELTIEYNKSRQQAITNEILDIIGGSLK